ncbi:hypothetical protein K466DRAFT_370672 [Polyporus arcularius HHB13444]|uniref:Uncharacterized protein n=1 Tax=Polyporus arcularius HHB13444 TaxID=1314778 RepID=A0A5C3PLJ5_9APHY|nr:hypothetical protein K466DRAFT_370672 [Polyporus arcularius HHB13444]
MKPRPYGVSRLSLESVESRGIFSTVVFCYVLQYFSAQSARLHLLLEVLSCSAAPRWLRVTSSHDPRFSLYRLFLFSDVHCMGSLYSALGTPALLLRSYPRPVTTPIIAPAWCVVRCMLSRHCFGMLSWAAGEHQSVHESGSSEYSFVSVTAILSILSPESSLPSPASQIPALLTPIAVARPRPLPARKIDKAGRQERDYQRTRHG